MTGWFWALLSVVLALSGSGAPAAEDKAIATYQLGAGWATFGLALPRGVATSGVRVGSLPTQTDVKTTWPDASVRFAVVTARIPKEGAYAIVAAGSGAGALAATWPAAAVTLDIGGKKWMAAVPAAGGEPWLAGPLVVERRWEVAPVSEGGSAHPFLRVLFDVRAYAGGGHRLDVCVENTLDTPAAAGVTYDVTIGANGKILWTKKAVTHGYMARWRKVFPVDGLVEASIGPDLEPALVSRALPRYLSVVANQVDKPEGPRYDILGVGSLNPDMRSHGGRPELAPYPDWTARYLVHRNATQRQLVLVHGDLAGSWPVHLREPEGGRYRGVGAGRVVSIDERNRYWADPRADPANRPAGQGPPPYLPDSAHVPSLAYVPYLLTGDRYYADEMSFWANFALLRTVPDAFSGGWACRGETPAGSRGLLLCNETRGIAWAVRNLADAAAYLPDGDAVKAYLAPRVSSNLEALDRMPPTPLGTPFYSWARGRQRPDGSRTVGIATWENNYVGWAIDRANDLGFAGGTALRETIARWQLLVLTSPDFPRQHVGNSVYQVGTLLDPAHLAGPVRLWPTLREVIEENGLTRGGQGTPLPGYYGVDIRLMTMVGVKQGWPGAQAAYDAVTREIAGDLAARAGWAIAPESPRAR